MAHTSRNCSISDFRASGAHTTTAPTRRPYSRRLMSWGVQGLERVQLKVRICFLMSTADRVPRRQLRVSESSALGTT